MDFVEYVLMYVNKKKKICLFVVHVNRERKPESPEIWYMDFRAEVRVYFKESYLIFDAYFYSSLMF